MRRMILGGFECLGEDFVLLFVVVLVGFDALNSRIRVRFWRVLRNQLHQRHGFTKKELKSSCFRCSVSM